MLVLSGAPNASPLQWAFAQGPVLLNGLICTIDLKLHANTRERHRGAVVALS